MSSPSNSFGKNLPALGKNPKNNFFGKGIMNRPSDFNIHDAYSNLNLVVFGDINLEAYWDESKQIWKKRPTKVRGMPYNWEKFQLGHKYNKNSKAFAIITGQSSNLTVIDIDDPTLPHNIELMELMKDCSMIQQTKKGYHYCYQFVERIGKGKSGGKVNDVELEIDTRNINNCIFCEPTHLCNDDGEVVATYKWIRLPSSPNDISIMPEAVLKKLDEIRPNFFLKSIPKPSVENEEVMEVHSTQSQQSTTSNPIVIPTSTSNEEKNVLLQLADCITNNDGYSDWLNNGIICFNEGLGVDVWEQMTIRTYPTYKKGSKRDCKEKWKSFQSNPDRKLTQASWWKWLKDNNYGKFKELALKRNDTDRLYKFINHKEFANIFYNLYPNAYLFNERMNWFQLGDGNVWKHYPNKEPEQILRRISDTLMKYTEELITFECQKYGIERAKITDGDRAKEFANAHKQRLQNLETGRQKFGSKEFCKGILAFLPSYYIRDTLEQELNMNPNLFSFSDGKCIDFSTGQVRDLLPTDYVSQTTGYPIPRQSNEEVREKLEKFLFGLFENQKVLEYFLNICATCLFGDNRFHEYYVFTGSGGNGKGVIASLLENCFGDYYHSVDITLFTKPRERADQPIPALVDARYKRLVMTTEPEKDDKFQKGLLKKVSGGDLIEARTLFSKDIIRYKPQFKVIFQTNAIPQIQMDDGISRRMKVVKFPFKFRPESECISDNHRVADPDIKHNICNNPIFRDEFVIWLISIFNDIKDWKSFPAPDEVKEATDTYFDDNNPIKFWLNEFFEITENKEDTIPASEMLRYWCRDKGVDKTSSKFLSEGLMFNGIEKKRNGSYIVYMGIKRKNDCLINNNN